MKKNLIQLFIAGMILVNITSCSKQSRPVSPTQNRTIKFHLYTSQNFSDNDSTINFSLFIKKTGETVFDSSLSAMQIKDIPDAAHKLVIIKTIQDNTDSELAAGFRYQIQNVGNSWHTDTLSSGVTFKIIDFDFQ